MQLAGRPLLLSHIAKRAKIAHQLVDYHLEQMIKKGIIYRVDDGFEEKYYLLQPVFYDVNWMNALTNQLIPFVEEMGQPGMVVLDQIEIPTEKAIVEILVAFLNRFEEEITSKSMQKFLA